MKHPVLVALEEACAASHDGLSSVNEVTARSGFSRSGALYALHRLAADGLAVQERLGWRPAAIASPAPPRDDGPR